MNAYWRAANYLSVPDYLLDNPLLKKPLKIEQSNRVSRSLGNDAGAEFYFTSISIASSTARSNMIYLAGPGHGGPGLVANTIWRDLFGDLSKHFRDEGGMKTALQAISFPGEFPATSLRKRPLDPRGGELGYSLAHAYGAVLDNPDLLRRASSAMAKRKNRPAGGELAFQ